MIMLDSRGKQQIVEGICTKLPINVTVRTGFRIFSVEGEDSAPLKNNVGSVLVIMKRIFVLRTLCY